MTAPSRSAIERLLAPRSVAIAGIGSAPGTLGGTVLDNLERYGFAGPIHLIHPTRAELAGRRCVASTADLPAGVDCVVLAIPGGAVLDAVAGCAARGVGGVVIFTAGFAELGPDGRAAQDRLTALARDSGMAVLGPNCLGCINDVAGVPLTFAPVERRVLAGPGVAVVSQSGAMASTLRAALLARDLDVTLTVSTGNEAVNGLEDFVETVLGEDHTRVVALIAEHIRQPRRFLRLAAEAQRQGKVLVMLHSGRSADARGAAATHTGAIAGDHGVMRTLATRAGVLMADTLEELIDLTDCLLRCPRRPFGGVAVLAESGAWRALTLDYCETIGLTLPQPEGAARESLDALAPGLIAAANPLDLTAQALRDPGLYERATEPLMAHPACGSLLVTIILTSDGMARRKMPPVIALLRHWAARRTTIFAMLGEDTPIPDSIIAEIRSCGVPFFRSPERALRALARFTAWADAPLPPIRDTEAVSPRLPRGILAEHTARQVLSTAGLRCPPWRLVQTRAGAVAAAAELGGPVVLKVQSAALTHKSDVGGVILGLDGPAAVQAGWDRLQANLAAHAPNVAIDGVLIEPMQPSGVELILGARRDPNWGCVVALGLGGVMAEALDDVCLLPPDADRPMILRALASLRGARLFGAFRGRPARDLDAVADAVRQVGAFMQAHPEVTELDINPLLALASGEGALMLDALIVAD